VRLFLAINLEPTVRRAVMEATTTLRDVAPTLSWVDEARLHLTLKFLGEGAENIIPALSRSIDQVAERHRPFSMHLGEIGAFPNFRHARVVWMGIDREPRLELLHHEVELACEKHGFEVDGRAFRPHLTLARVKDRAELDELRLLSRASKQVDFRMESMAQSVDLMKSVTIGGSGGSGGSAGSAGSAGSRYECLHVAPLRSH
jgi:RNA 2',3'-cyclic 3'-phosphodiesterase